MILLPIYYQRLPTLTTILARPAKTLGAFGLVPYSITYPYQVRACDGAPDSVGLVSASGGLPIVTKHYRPLDLRHPRPCVTFTNRASADGNRTYVGL